MLWARAPGAKAQALLQGACRPDQEANPKDSKPKLRGLCRVLRRENFIPSLGSGLGVTASPQALELARLSQWGAMPSCSGWCEVMPMVVKVPQILPLTMEEVSILAMCGKLKDGSPEKSPSLSPEPVQLPPVANRTLQM